MELLFDAGLSYWAGDSVFPFPLFNFIVSKVTVEPLGTDTSLLRAVSNVPTKFSYIFFKKKTPL